MNGKRLTVKEVAGIYNVTVPTVYGWMRAGHLPHLKIGGTLRVRPEDLEAMEARAWQGQNSEARTTGSNVTDLGTTKSAGAHM